MSTADSHRRAPPRLAGGARIRIIQAPYYAAMVDGMRRGAERVLEQGGATVSEVVDVAGAFELPVALQLALRGRDVHDGHLVLGCVVKGETDHYDHICREASRGIMDVALQHAAPLGFGLLTVHTLAQAEARSADDDHNKGAEAATALLMQIALARRWGRA